MGNPVPGGGELKGKVHISLSKELVKQVREATSEAPVLHRDMRPEAAGGRAEEIAEGSTIGRVRDTYAGTRLSIFQAFA